MKNFIVSLVTLCLICFVSSFTLSAQNQLPEEKFQIKYAYDTLSMNLNFDTISSSNFLEVNKLMQKFFEVAEKADESTLSMKLNVDELKLSPKSKLIIHKFSIQGDRLDVLETVREEWNKLEANLR